MAFIWLWHCGFETGTSSTLSAYQDCFDKSGGSYISGTEVDADSSGTVRNGRYAYEPLGAEANQTQFVGDYTAFDGNETFVVYHAGLNYQGKSGGSADPNNEWVILLRFTADISDEERFYGLAMKWGVWATTHDVNYSIVRINQANVNDTPATSYTSTTLTDTTRSWPRNLYTGLLVTSGSNTMTVLTNSATVLTGTSWSPSTPGGTDDYSIAAPTGSNPESLRDPFWPYSGQPADGIGSVATTESDGFITVVITCQLNDGTSEAGTATSTGVATMTKTGAGWTTNEWEGHSVTMGGGEQMLIKSNTTDELTGIAAWWDATPSGTDTFTISSAIVFKLYVDGVLAHTLKDTADATVRFGTLHEPMNYCNDSGPAPKAGAKSAVMGMDDLAVGQWDGVSETGDMIDLLAADDHHDGYGEILYQPKSDIPTESDYTGTNNNKWRNLDDRNEETNCADSGDDIDSTATNDYQWVQFAREASGIIESARIRWLESAGIGEAWADDPDNSDTPTVIFNGDDAGGTSVGQTWHGVQMSKTPRGTPAVWTRDLFNAFEGGVKTTTHTHTVEEMILSGWGHDLVRPAKNNCASLNVPRRPLRAMIGR